MTGIFQWGITLSLCLGPLFLAFGFSLIWLRVERKKNRAPLPFKLLRAPGESLRRNIEAIDESVLNYLPILIISIPIALVLVLSISVWLFPTNSFAQVVLIGGAFLFCTVVITFFWMSKIRARRNYLLGYLGERAVGEYLNQLDHRGFRVFHDVPAESKGSEFNLDHVVVGPTGLFAVETKTRRKGRSRPGFKDHIVTFDGTQLIWPWGEDQHGLNQAIREAKWLEEWLNSMTGLVLKVQPILALPGWFVEMKARGAVLVMNEKNLVGAISSPAIPNSLTTSQINLIVRQLEDRCRDVED